MMELVPARMSSAFSRPISTRKSPIPAVMPYFNEGGMTFVRNAAQRLQARPMKMSPETSDTAMAPCQEKPMLTTTV